ncbi:RICIN domain-containing protein [Kibdelosporangium phytohabitans]|uniref:Ricin B lectin domain-containing protein n=1 Tax=Kibdelosporangium phytohabitans TaxID=860235 RepID=A0A0N9ICA5_9PSEU|nr:RICIN domain-containing protein [Kibdelosporangium phytohabitans]ALG13920.1 hypothetical protein AOZ06_49910 [Kibdelosporangium phytohabitans]MBE1467143.1 hypothetical protein [Kibdelosporangium phytohabitans]
MRKLLIGLLAVLAAVVFAPTANAAIDAKIGNRANGRCLDGAASGNPGLQPCRVTNGQVWKWAGSVPSTGTMRHTLSGKCLDSNARGDVYLLTCQAGNNNQKWKMGRFGTSIEIKNVATGRCLSRAQLDVFRLDTYGCNTADTLQKWTITNIMP